MSSAMMYLSSLLMQCFSKLLAVALSVGSAFVGALLLQQASGSPYLPCLCVALGITSRAPYRVAEAVGKVTQVLITSNTKICDHCCFSVICPEPDSCEYVTLCFASL